MRVKMDTRVDIDNRERIEAHFDKIGVKRVVDKKKKQLIGLILVAYTIDHLTDNPSNESKELRRILATQSVKLTIKWRAIVSYMQKSEMEKKRSRLYKAIDDALATFLPDKGELEYTGHVLFKSLEGYARNYVNEIIKLPFLMFAAPVVAPLGAIAAVINTATRNPLTENEYVALALDLTTLRDATADEQKEFIALIMANNMEPKFNQSDATQKLITKLKDCIMHACDNNNKITYAVSDHIRGIPVDLEKLIGEVICYIWEQNDKGYFLNNGKDLFWEIIAAKHAIDEKKQNV